MFAARENRDFPVFVFYKGGHEGQTDNTMVCIEATRRGVLILSNDVRAEAGFADLVRFILGDTSVPYDWGVNPGRDTLEGNPIER